MSAALSVYYKQFLAQIKAIQTRFPVQKPRLLLHSCCGPCSSAVLEVLIPHFDVAIFYYNPNIYPEPEFVRRRDEQIHFVKAYLGENAPHVINAHYDPEEFYTVVKDIPDYETEHETGERCRACYTLRMRRTGQYAADNNFDFFTTALSISPHKDAAKINNSGMLIQKELNDTVQYLFTDFKKKNGFKRSLDLSAEYGLYRQDYCGCVFSKINR